MGYCEDLWEELNSYLEDKDDDPCDCEICATTVEGVKGLIAAWVCEADRAECDEVTFCERHRGWMARAIRYHVPEAGKIADGLLGDAEEDCDG